MQNPEPTILSVTQLNESLNDLLGQFEVLVQGEVSSYKISHNKWVTFDLKDENSRINCFMTTYQQTVPLEDGMEIVVKGKASIYTPYGKLSFKPYFIKPVGEGALKKAYEMTKKLLESEGLFSNEHKQAIPTFPQRIGIVTSQEAAAYTDVLRIINNRWQGLEIFLYPAKVQGETAPQTIVDGLDYFNKKHPVDVIILTRGGGSLEDLQAFNAESVCRGVFASKIPIICGVGHERDETLAEYVADKRASTPSNAAEIAVPDKESVMYQLQATHDRLSNSMQNYIMQVDHTLSSLENRLGLYLSRVDSLLDTYAGKLTTSIEKLTLSIHESLRRYEDVFKSLNPTSVLARGYSITLSKGKPITSAKQLTTNAELLTRFADGEIRSIVTDTAYKKNKKKSQRPPQKNKTQQSLL